MIIESENKKSISKSSLILLWVGYGAIVAFLFYLSVIRPAL